MTTDLIPVPATVRIAVRGGGTFPVRRIYCVGRNFVEHAKEMGMTAPTSKTDRGHPIFFSKPADAIVTDGIVPYPPATDNLHHEVELVVALGQDAPAGILPVADAERLILGYGIGLDLTRRDLQAAAKAKGLPWDSAKGFDHSAPVSELIRIADIDDPESLELSLSVNGRLRQQAPLHQMIWNVAEILHELSRLYALRAGDLIFMGTPAGVAALRPGDEFVARLADVVELRGTVIQY
ncbi:MAG: fumarylacetoacetate hydrolase family protein [Xanthomonadaceae bacterium]|jgi:2-keto-4-pentenoate hydratase/2-oxohepta-3-ene-1,7-dioic acid hydratase in catechol pathway|nr:fumarylacetoacetate hydrolase family protein [Xanthomonadaceae bacterium]